jgi:tRNA-splicing ligase RtcB
MAGFAFIPVEGGVPIKAWINGVFVENQAMQQLRNVAAMPFVLHHVAAMPDVHWGMGATVGSVIATRGAMIPAAVGVDIGCGMMAARTTVRAERLPDDLRLLRDAIEAAVPHGRTDNGGVNDCGAWAEPPPEPLRHGRTWKPTTSESARCSPRWRTPAPSITWALSAPATTSSNSAWTRRMPCG